MTQDKLPNLFVVSCNSQDKVDSDFLWSLLGNIFTYGNAGGKVKVFRTKHPLDAVRNNMGFDAFLKDKEYDICARCDVDQWYPEDYFFDTVPLVEKHKVIGPVIYDRMPFNNYAPLVIEKPWGRFIPIDGLTGIHKFPYTHINNFYAREVLEAVSPPWFEALLTEDGMGRANHPDYTFLDRIREAGYDIYTNCDITVEHLVQVRVDKEFHQKMRGNHVSKRIL